MPGEDTHLLVLFWKKWNLQLCRLFFLIMEAKGEGTFQRKILRDRLAPRKKSNKLKSPGETGSPATYDLAD